MDTGAWLLLLGCALIAEVIGTMAGFGAATILTPIAALFLDVKTAIALVACFHLFGTASRLIFFHRSVQWTIWWQFGLIGIIASLLGARATMLLPSAFVTLFFGAFLLIYVVLSSARSQPLVLPAQPSTLMAGGACSGFIAGLIGTGGAIRSVCLLAIGLSKDVYIGTSAAIALVVDATRVPVYLAGHLIPSTMASVLASLVGVAFAGSWVGQRLVRRVSGTLFRRVVLTMLFIMGCKMLIDGWRGLAS
jgi:uncharacterized membrane protein YfcA